MALDSKKVFEIEGEVIAILPGTKFKVEVEVAGQKKTLIGYLSGRMRKHYIKILEGDRVRMEITPYDPTQGRIVYRMKHNESTSVS